MKKKLILAEGLTSRQKTFIEAYVRFNHDVTLACREAGYTNNASGRAVLKSGKGADYLQELELLKAELLKKTLQYGAVESFNNLQRAQDIALKKQRMVVSKTGVYKHPDEDLTNFIKAEELKGKLAGLYKQEEEEKKPMTIMNIIRYNGKKEEVKVEKKTVKVKKKKEAE